MLLKWKFSLKSFKGHIQDSRNNIDFYGSLNGKKDLDSDRRCLIRVVASRIASKCHYKVIQRSFGSYKKLNTKVKLKNR